MNTIEPKKEQITNPKYFVIGNYQVMKALCEGVGSIQANLYLVMKKEKKFCAKVYHNEGQLEIEASSLKKVKSDFVIGFIEEHCQAECWKNDEDMEIKEVLIEEYAECGDLVAYISLKPSFSQEACKSIFLSILNGIEDIYKQGVAHRDIKPQNIVIDHFFNLKICDFGHSISFQEGIPLQKGAIGTRRYRAPQVKQQSYFGLPADLYSATIILFLLLLPYPTEIQNVVRNDQNSIKKLEKLWQQKNKGAKIPQELLDIFQKMFNKNPSQRFTLQQLKENKWLCATEEAIKLAKLEIQKRYKFIMRQKQKKKSIKKKTITELSNEVRKQEHGAIIIQMTGYRGSNRSSGSSLEANNEEIDEKIIQEAMDYRNHFEIDIENFPQIGGERYQSIYSLPPNLFVALVKNLIRDQDAMNNVFEPLQFKITSSKFQAQKNKFSIALQLTGDQEQFLDLVLKGNMFQIKQEDLEQFTVIWQKHEGDQFLLEILLRFINDYFQFQE